MSKADLIKYQPVRDVAMATQQLFRLQRLPLEQKIPLTERRISEFYNYFQGKVYISFSGGKDSDVLLNIARRLFPDILAVFVDTGLEYPEIREFVKSIDNVAWLKPEMSFPAVIQKYGYPAISKEQAKYIREVQNGTTAYTESKRRGKIIGRNGRPVGSVSQKWQYLMDQKEVMISEKCCDALKKKPMKKFFKESGMFPITGIMAEESRLRLQSYAKYGCNGFQMNEPQSRPMSFWTESDVWEYIKKYNLPYSSIYDMGYPRTGCMFCMFGVQLEKPGNTRFDKMKVTHPKQYDYCMNKLGIKKVLALLSQGKNRQKELDL